jgi:hypothetical protein
MHANKYIHTAQTDIVRSWRSLRSHVHTFRSYMHTFIACIHTCIHTYTHKNTHTRKSRSKRKHSAKARGIRRLGALIRGSLGMAAIVNFMYICAHIQMRIYMLTYWNLAERFPRGFYFYMLRIYVGCMMYVYVFTTIGELHLKESKNVIWNARGSWIAQLVSNHIGHFRRQLYSFGSRGCTRGGDST